MACLVLLFLVPNSRCAPELVNEIYPLETTDVRLFDGTIKRTRKYKCHPRYRNVLKISERTKLGLRKFKYRYYDVMWYWHGAKDANCKVTTPYPGTMYQLLLNQCGIQTGSKFAQQRSDAWNTISIKHNCAVEFFVEDDGYGDNGGNFFVELEYIVEENLNSDSNSSRIDSCSRGKMGLKDLGSSFIVFLVDLSGSMKGVRLSKAKESISNITSRMLSARNTEVLIYGFSGDCINPICSKSRALTSSAEVESFLGTLTAGGSTPLSAAIKRVLDDLDKRAVTHLQNTMVILCDGDDDCGDVENLAARIAGEITFLRIETLGIEISPGGQGARDLAKLAEATGGNYSLAESSDEMEQRITELLNEAGILNIVGSWNNPNQRKPLTTSKKVDSQVKWEILK